MVNSISKFGSHVFTKYRTNSYLNLLWSLWPTTVQGLGSELIHCPPGIFWYQFKNTLFITVLLIGVFRSYVAQRSMRQDLCNDKSMMVQVMAWCCQPTSHYLTQYYPDLCIHMASHDDVIKWKHFPRYWPFMREIHRSPVNSPNKGQWRGALMFSLICAWTNSWVNNRDTGDLKRHRAHYDITVMLLWLCLSLYMYYHACHKITPWFINHGSCQIRENLNSLEINHDHFPSMSSPNFRLSGGSLGYWTTCNNFKRYCTLPYCDYYLLVH